MRRKIVVRGLLGIPLGICIGYLITVICSVVNGDGTYYPVAPKLIEYCKTEINAVILQTVLCGVLGFACDASTVIWEMDDWSILKQNVIHFLIISCSMLPIAYFTHWMEHTVKGVSIYFGIFIGIYVISWFVQYLSWKRKIQEMNRRI